ncbi:MAG: Uma2 family endonuclease [Thermosynechococcaceae cyanobacterium]
MTSIINLIDQIEYPSEDGQPVAESDFQREYLLQSVEMLRHHFQSRSDVYVSGNLFIYYEQGNPKAVVAPDVFVVLGISNHDRMSYKLWEENNQVPAFVMEVTSKSTVSEDQGVKKGLYAFLGIQEYFQYDPTGDYLEPRLQGLRLMEGNYLPIPAMTSDAQDSLIIPSATLDLELHLQAGELRFYNPQSQAFLRNYRETDAALQQAEKAMQQAETARQQAEQLAKEERLRAERLAVKLKELGIDPQQL